MLLWGLNLGDLLLLMLTLTKISHVSYSFSNLTVCVYLTCNTVFKVSSFAIMDHSPVNSAWCVLCGFFKLSSSSEQNAKSHPISVQNGNIFDPFSGQTLEIA